ncbi:MAG TPA: 2-succinyl-5-enolpyruvyl-6-hydroxy-3-cyclohexene-1-carboxylic-acid synthase [Polyangiaceae bacterium]|nr:2-succinyl-5-enolpyruvyl-6-hydroxy-3-cyclohexene-1-carboxylic-acid synthase [Polyangiaceae bacterium]
MSASRPAEGQSAAHLIGEWARLIFATLRDAGVRDVWVSPGSRSTPFTWAALDTKGLMVRSVVDERSAAFLALGHARVTGRPSALLCTSGTAAANYFPAVVEASQSHLPLVVLTADRPLEVQHASASQTIDQSKLYGDFARRFYDLGLPDRAPSALIGLRRSVTQAVAESLGPLPGPVHLNLRARKPLEPTSPSNDTERALSAQISDLIARPIARYAPVAGLANEAIRAAARTLSGAASGIIAVGPLPAFGQDLAEPIAQLSRLIGFPIFAEAASQVRFALTDHELAFPLFDWLLSAPSVAEKLRPEVLLCLGHTLTSSAFERWAASIPHRIVLADHGLPDPLGTATLAASGNLAAALTSLLNHLHPPPPPTASSTYISNPSATVQPPPSAHVASHLDSKSNPSATAQTPPSAHVASHLDSKSNPSATAQPPRSGHDASHLDSKYESRLSWKQGPLVRVLIEAQTQCQRLLDDVLRESGEGLPEGLAVRAVVEAMPAGAVLALGNSLPIRDVDAYVTRAARVCVASQRGASGIDGLVSGAIGSAIGSGAPTVLLVGDVSLLHDLGGLASASLVTTPLVIAVIDNAGGRIFDQLPVQSLYGGKPEAARLWLTPPPRELSHAAALFGLGYAAPEGLEAIGAAVAAALAEPRVTLLHLRVAPESAAQLRKRVLAALASGS